LIRKRSVQIEKKIAQLRIIIQEVFMHISEGVLSAPVLISGGALALAGASIGLKKIDYEHIAQVGVLSSAFFVASLIHVNVGPSSVHLVLNGLVGLILGWAAIPAVLVALILQAVFFQFGGLTTLGVNTVIMAFPAVICYYIFTPIIHKDNALALFAAFSCGFFSVFLSALFMGLALIFTEENFWEVSWLIVIANLPVMIIEGIITIFCLLFLKKVHPAMLPGYED
jgi:cobalt/nickel transport system permease protein